MNVKRANRDLTVVLPAYRERRRRQGRAIWSDHTWRAAPEGGFELLLRNFPLPPNARPRRTHLKIEGRDCLYDSAGPGMFHYYRNVWLGDAIEIRTPGAANWGALPRLYSPGTGSWRYCCIHPELVDSRTNITTLLRVLELFIINADPRVR